MKLEQLLHGRNMRLFNLGAIGLITVAFLIRFYYFGARERFVEIEYSTLNAAGETVTGLRVEKAYTRDSFWMFLYTLFVFPVMIFIFVAQEMQITNERLSFICEHFCFLDYHIGKGLYIMLMATFILQHNDVMQWLIALILFVVVVINFIHPCIFGASPVNGGGPLIGLAQTDKALANELKLAEEEDAKKRVIKVKDPAKTDKVKQEIEAEGKSIVDEKNMSMNADRSSGKGTLKVRFQVAADSSGKSSPLKASAGKGQAMASSLKASRGGEQLLKSSPPKKMSQSYVDDTDNRPQILKSGRPRTQENHISGNSIQMTETADDIEKGLLSKKGSFPEDEDDRRGNQRQNPKRFRRPQGRQRVQFVESGAGQRQTQLRSPPTEDLEAQNKNIKAFEGEVLENLERSILTPDRSAGQELLSSGQESTSYEDVSRVAATLYLEMKRCINARSLKAFREAILVAKEIIKKQQGRSPMIAKLAAFRNEQEQTLLHEAALASLRTDDARFFTELVALGFPLYDEDCHGNFAAFTIAELKGDGVFLEAFKALARANFDVVRASQGSRHRETFIQRLCQSDNITVQKMQALLTTQPSIDPEMVQQLIKARVELSRRHGSENAARSAIDLMQSYIDKTYSSSASQRHYQRRH